MSEVKVSLNNNGDLYIYQYTDVEKIVISDYASLLELMNQLKDAEKMMIEKEEKSLLSRKCRLMDEIETLQREIKIKNIRLKETQINLTEIHEKLIKLKKDN